MTLKIEMNHSFQHFREEKPEKLELDARMRIKEFSIEPCSTSVNLLIETLIKEIKAVVTGNSFEN